MSLFSYAQLATILALTAVISACGPRGLGERQLLVFNRNLETLKKQATKDENASANNYAERARISKRALAIAGSLPEEQEKMDNNHAVLHWRYQLIEALLSLQRNRSASSPSREQKKELLELGNTQLQDLTTRYSHLDAIESATSYEQLGQVFLQCNLPDLSKQCTERAI